jgi:hypothetical protein
MQDILERRFGFKACGMSPMPLSCGSGLQRLSHDWLLGAPACRWLRFPGINGCCLLKISHFAGITGHAFPVAAETAALPGKKHAALGVPLAQPKNYRNIDSKGFAADDGAAFGRALPGGY